MLQLAGQRFGRGLRRAAGDEDAGAAIGAGVVAAMRGVGLLQTDAIDRRRQRGRGDLAMHGAGAVAEFGRADRQVEAAILAQRNAAIGEMPGRRHGVDHGQRDAVAGQPVRGERGLRRLGGHRALDQVEALIEAVAAVEHVVIFGLRRRQHGIAGLDDIAAAHLERADAELFGQFVDRGFDGDQCLRQAVAAKRARRHGVGIGGDAVDLLVRAIIDADAFADRMKQHRAGMVAVGAGVGEHVELQRGQFAVLVGAGLDGDAHRMPRRGRDELLFPRQFEFDRPAGLQRGQRQNVLDEHFLLAAEAAADALAEHPDLVGRQIEEVGQRAPRQERHLRAGADIEDAVGIDPGEPAMGFQRGMLDPLAS